MKKVIIAGGSGLVGQVLSKVLLNKGYEVNWLSRTRANHGSIKRLAWDVENQQLDPAYLEGAECIINLTGAGIADKKWTEERKKEILNSRVKSMYLLARTIKKLDKKPKMFLSASATGFYGLTETDKKFSETDIMGRGFLAETSSDWESAALQIEALGIKTTIVRIGLVLSNNGGALPEMKGPVKYGLGAALGSGKQYMPWIHELDLANAFVHLMENQETGIFNGVAPQPVTNKVFMETLAKVLNKPFFLPAVPSFVMQLLLGDRSILVLKGNNVDAYKIQQLGFQFQFKTLESALKDLSNS